MKNQDKILSELIKHFFDIDVNAKDDTIGCRYLRTSPKIISGSRADIDKYFIDIIDALCEELNCNYEYWSTFSHIQFKIRENKELELGGE